MGKLGEGLLGIEERVGVALLEGVARPGCQVVQGDLGSLGQGMARAHEDMGLGGEQQVEREVRIV